MKPVVLDKNYLQGASTASVRKLAESHRLVMTGALFYELLTTSTYERRICFAKLPQLDNPVELVDHIGVLLNYEIEHGQPCGKPSTHRLRTRFRFNEKLLDSDYQLPEDAAGVLLQQTRGINADVEQLLDLSQQTPDLFPGLLLGSTDQQLQSRADAENVIAQVDEIHRFYENLEPNDPHRPHPRIESTAGDWAHIRWIQVLMLFALDVYFRYRGGIREDLTEKVRERLEHDVHDAQLLALAVLEGSFATREKKLLRWWYLLKPNGPIFS